MQIGGTSIVTVLWVTGDISSIAGASAFFFCKEKK